MDVPLQQPGKDIYAATSALILVHTIITPVHFWMNRPCFPGKARGIQDPRSTAVVVLHTLALLHQPDYRLYRHSLVPLTQTTLDCKLFLCSCGNATDWICHP